MSNDIVNWFSVCRAGGHVFVCAGCDNEFDLQIPSLDHHPSRCPVCSVECLYWSASAGNLQMIPEKAPAPLRRTIRWAQANLDECEFVELTVALEELFSTFGLTGEIKER